MSRILFATSEAHPLVKTGGLADVSGSLPAALERLGEEVRIVLPAYRAVLDKLKKLKSVATLKVPAVAAPIRILEGRMPDSGVTLWLVDSPVHFDRVGSPYSGSDGRDWCDNPHRFAAFCRAIVEIACDRAGLGWRPDVVHCNDWQTGLVPALLGLESHRPATLFTIHNLAYQGVFAAHLFHDLALPAPLWSVDGLEFHGTLSFIKGGLARADWITTVSPTYAHEIRTPQFGYGLEGLLDHRTDRLVGILNGCDYQVWDPAHDPLIPRPFTVDSIQEKAADKRALQARFGLPQEAWVPLIGLVGRLVEQKGVDLVVEALPTLVQWAQVVLVGTGEKWLERALRAAAEHHPQRLAVHIGYDEELAHLVEAGADMFLMPSRFEPCGLNQLYSLRYGTVPIVRRTGGLNDTVVDASWEGIEHGTATGFVFGPPNVSDLLWATQRAIELYPDRERWTRLAANGMRQDFSWEQSARQYIELYRRAVPV